MYNMLYILLYYISEFFQYFSQIKYFLHFLAKKITVLVLYTRTAIYKDNLSESKMIKFD